MPGSGCPPGAARPRARGRSLARSRAGPRGDRRPRAAPGLRTGPAAACGHRCGNDDGSSPRAPHRRSPCIPSGSRCSRRRALRRARSGPHSRGRHPDRSGNRSMPEAALRGCRPPQPGPVRSWGGAGGAAAAPTEVSVEARPCREIISPHWPWRSSPPGPLSLRRSGPRRSAASANRRRWSCLPS